jgi:hypothetical protein
VLDVVDIPDGGAVELVGDVVDVGAEDRGEQA